MTPALILARAAALVDTTGLLAALAAAVTEAGGSILGNVYADCRHAVLQVVAAESKPVARGWMGLADWSAAATAADARRVLTLAAETVAPCPTLGDAVAAYWGVEVVG